MGSPASEGSSPPAWAAAIDDLTKGRQSSATLASLLHLDPQVSPTAKVLLEEIMNTISKTIAVLESGKSKDSMDSQVDSPSSDVTTKGPREKRKIHSTRKAAKRKGGHPYSWSTITSASIEDGYTWRKYGQKVIFCAKHPRCYYRCTYKNERGCKATRQVQKSENDPFLYVITYFGEHTCRGVKEEMPSCREPCVISFESNTVCGIKPADTPFSSLPSNKQENEEEVESNVTSSGSPSDCFVPPEMELQNPSMIGLEPDLNDLSPGYNPSITSYDPELMALDVDILSFYQLDELFKW